MSQGGVSIGEGICLPYTSAPKPGTRMNTANTRRSASTPGRSASTVSLYGPVGTTLRTGVRLVDSADAPPDLVGHSGTGTAHQPHSGGAHPLVPTPTPTPARREHRQASVPHDQVWDLDTVWKLGFVLAATLHDPFGPRTGLRSN